MPAISPRWHSLLKQTIPRPVNLTSAVAELSWTDMMFSYRRGIKELSDWSDVCGLRCNAQEQQQRQNQIDLHNQPPKIFPQRNLRCLGTFRTLACFPLKNVLIC